MVSEGLNRQPMGPSVPAPMTAKKTKKGKSLHEKMRQLYETLRDYKDTKGRQLSLIFLRLPNMKEFPDYYEVIKRPIDFEKIGAKLKQGLYQNLESCFDDFALMFDNACKFNEPDSQIYKDALTLNGLAKQ
jgi:protein polybromo-1